MDPWVGKTPWRRERLPTPVFWPGEFRGLSRASLVAQMVKNLPAVQETWVGSLGWEDPLEEGMATTPVFLPGESHGQRSLAGYSPQGLTGLKRVRHD